MELKGTPEDLVNDLIRELLCHGVDNGLPLTEIQCALDNAGIIASINEVTEFTGLIREHRRTCPDCSADYNIDGTTRDDVDYSTKIH